MGVLQTGSLTLLVQASGTDGSASGHADSAFPIHGCIHALHVDPLARLPFTSGSVEVIPGNKLVGATSSATGIVMHVDVISGSWADGDAAGNIYLTRRQDFPVSGTFTAEDLDNSTNGADGVATGAALVIPKSGLTASLGEVAEDAPLAPAVAFPDFIASEEITDTASDIWFNLAKATGTGRLQLVDNRRLRAGISNANDVDAVRLTLRWTNYL